MISVLHVCGTNRLAHLVVLWALCVFPNEVITHWASETGLSVSVFALAGLSFIILSEDSIYLSLSLSLSLSLPLLSLSPTHSFTPCPLTTLVFPVFLSCYLCVSVCPLTLVHHVLFGSQLIKNSGYLDRPQVKTWLNAQVT